MNIIKQLIYDFRMRNSNEEIKRIYNEAKKNWVKKIWKKITINGVLVTLWYVVTNNSNDPYRFFRYSNYEWVEIEDGYWTLRNYVIELSN